MAMGKRTSKQAPMFVAATELPVSPGHPFYAKLNTILDGAGFDRFAAPLTLHAGFRPSPEWSTDEPIVSKTHQF